MTTTTAQTSSSAQPVSGDACQPCGARIAGTLLARILVPAWLLAGAGGKLALMNPKLLPQPVLSVVSAVAGVLNVPMDDAYDPALRVIVAAEIGLGLTMIFAPRLSRFVAGTVLLLFCVILTMVLASGATSCGCFGKSGPPPWLMLTIDGALLLGVLALPVRKCVMSWGATVGTVVAAFVVGGVVAVMAPGPKAIQMAPPAVAPPGVDPPAVKPQPANPPAVPSDATPKNPPGNGAGTLPPPAAATPWPPAPAQAQPYYTPEVKDWVGKRFDAQDIALVILQPLPVNPNVGRLHVVFIREDCDHCHKLLQDYFSGHLTTPVMTVVVPDATGEPLENPCVECKKAALVKGPIYMLTSPLLITLKDGVIVAVCEDVDKPEEVRKALNAGK